MRVILYGLRHVEQWLCDSWSLRYHATHFWMQIQFQVRERRLMTLFSGMHVHDS